MISNIPTLAADQHRERSQADMLEATLGEPLTKEQIAAARALDDEYPATVLCDRCNGSGRFKSAGLIFECNQCCNGFVEA